MGITLHWRRFRCPAWMRCKGHNVLYVPGVAMVHGSTYASSSLWQRQLRGPPPPRGRPPPEASCTSPSGNPKTLQGIHLHQGSIPFTNALLQTAYPGHSDMECTPSFPNHQEFSEKSSGEQSYDLERDFTTSGPTLGSTFSAPRGPSQVQQLRKTLAVGAQTGTKFAFWRSYAQCLWA